MEERLQQLALEAQSYPPGSTKRQTTEERLQQLALEAQSCPLGSTQRQETLTKLMDVYLRYTVKSKDLQATLTKLLTRPMDVYLQKLALEAQNYPPRSTQRQETLTKLMDAIWRSNRLCHPRRGEFGDNYEDIYDEARVALLEYICKKIDKYRSDQPVLAWVNCLFKYRFTEAIPEILPMKPPVPPPDTEPTLVEKMMKEIELDPQGIYANEKMKKYPHVNFRLVALRKLAGWKWIKICQEVNISCISTVSSFYERSLKKFESKLFNK